MEIDFDFAKGGGLLPAIIQDIHSGKVLMLGYMNREALERTRQLGKVFFYSRTRGKLWMKGETSGHTLIVREILIDCDQDTLLIKVEPKGPVCHEGYSTCFYRRINEKGEIEVIEKKLMEPEEIYGKGA